MIGLAEVVAGSLLLAPPAAGGVQLAPAAPTPAPSAAQTAQPFQEDAMGPIRDVTSNWTYYQPRSAFCVRPDVGEYTPGGSGATATGRDPACRRSGFSPAARGLVKIAIRTPTLCGGCRRLFIDFSHIPPTNAPPYYYARGHAFYRLTSANGSYTVDPLAHSPNTKNFTNDRLLAPSGSPQEQVLGALDLHQFFGYVTDTTHFVHTAAQGPYYIGPWYINRQGRRIEGVYLDVDVADATRYSDARLNAVGYGTGFNSGQACPSDDDSFYGGCVDWWSLSTSTADPFAASRSG